MASKKELEARLSLQQRKAAFLLIENELEPDGGQTKSQDDLAEEIGCSRMTLYRWRTQNKTFIEYMNLLADDLLSSYRGRVYRRLMQSIDTSQPSIKAIDIYMKRHGLLTDKTVVETTEYSRTNEDLAKEMDELDKILEDIDEE
jgi:hypothetical protein